MSAVERASKAWAGAPPDWVLLLAEQCDLAPQTQVAKRLGYSPSVVNAVIGNKYPGDLNRVQATVMGAFAGGVVDCPVAGPKFPRQRCIREQRAPLDASHPIRAQFYRACRSGCPHSHIKEGGK